jgi:hypothetical protein
MMIIGDTLVVLGLDAFGHSVRVDHEFGRKNDASDLLENSRLAGPGGALAQQDHTGRLNVSNLGHHTSELSFFPRMTSRFSFFSTSANNFHISSPPFLVHLIEGNVGLFFLAIPSCIIQTIRYKASVAKD